MQIQFDANQDYQLQAVNAVVDLFEGQPYVASRLQLSGEAGGFSVIANRLGLEDTDIVSNLQRIQRANGISPVDERLQTLDATIEVRELNKTVKREVAFPNYSIEMETGTGKTYVYIRTALELARRYGLLKYIIVVPSVAIREGVLKTFGMTRQHFGELFGNLSYRPTVYDSGKLSALREFAESPTVEFLIITIDSFNKDVNVIRQAGRDEMGGIPALHRLQDTRPILILDEPQNFKTKAREEALASLNPLLALRYSATHPKGKAFSRVYRLTPYDAYRRRLVKRIEVAGVEQVGSAAVASMRLEEVKVAGSAFVACIRLRVLGKDGQISAKVRQVKQGDNLAAKTNMPDYAPFTVQDIYAEGMVEFSNGTILRLGESSGPEREAIFDAQIRYTIQSHFRRQRSLRQHGIKVLSLFFIDRVDNYALEDGVIRRLFRRAFDELKVDYAEWRDVDAEAVQGAYFAQRSGKPVDSKTGEAQADREAYDLIMRDKESLLTFPAPTDDEETRRKRQVCFIFSHSALREGWDNPNVFQICTLNQSQSEMRKRQEIGRGVRLAVNQAGQRVHDERMNVLTVVANESYESYVKTLQTEVESAYGLEAKPPAPPNARQRDVARLKPKYFELNHEFSTLWEKIKHKTRYHVRVDTTQLVDEVVQELNRTNIAPPSVSVTRSMVDVQAADEYLSLVAGRPRIMSEHPARATSHNLVALMLHMLQFTNPPVRITRQTLLDIVRRLDDQRREDALNNPPHFASVAIRLIRSKLADQLVDGIKYVRINEWYEMTQFDAEIEAWSEYLVEANKSLYDHVIVDSGIERQFVDDLENGYGPLIIAYVKLPAWFVVPTPVGTYNPDWAIVMKDDDDETERLYLVAETKGTTNEDELRPDERRKIQCGRRHFTDALAGVQYRHVASVRELLLRPD